MEEKKHFVHGVKSLLLLAFLMFSYSAISQYTIAVDKGGRIKRLNFYAGDYLKVKLDDKSKLGGNLEMINDTSFIINGRHILLTEVEMVYTKRPVFRYLGGTLIIAGTFFMAVDVLNNGQFSMAITPPALTSLGLGLVLRFFGTRRTKVKDNNFRVFNTTPIPILPENKTE